MSAEGPDRNILTSRRASAPRRRQARIVVELTEREARSLVRATTLVADVLRPMLFSDGDPRLESPLVTAQQTIVAACERAGVDIGVPARTRRQAD